MNSLSLSIFTQLYRQSPVVSKDELGTASANDLSKSGFEDSAELTRIHSIFSQMLTERLAAQYKVFCIRWIHVSCSAIKDYASFTFAPCTFFMSLLVIIAAIL